MRGKLIVVSGPSGSGKSTATKRVRDELKIPLSVSATTRLPREGEVDGKDYYFITKEEFETNIENDGFYEFANVHGNYYGTLKSEIESKLNEGQTVILEIDVQGGLIVKQKNKEAILVYFKAPSLEELEKRLRYRNTDSNEVIETRLKNAKKELEYEHEYDYSIINKNIDDACGELVKIIIK